VDTLLRPPLPPAWEVPDWVVDRAEADRIIAAVCSRGGGAVGITTALEGAGGFGKTTFAEAVCAGRRVRRPGPVDCSFGVTPSAVLIDSAP